MIFYLFYILILRQSQNFLQGDFFGRGAPLAEESARSTWVLLSLLILIFQKLSKNIQNYKLDKKSKEKKFIKPERQWAMLQSQNTCSQLNLLRWETKLNLVQTKIFPVLKYHDFALKFDFWRAFLTLK